MSLRNKAILLFAACMSAFVGSILPSNLQVVFFVLHVFTLGIAHGSLDRWISKSKESRKTSTGQFVLNYLIVVMTMVTLWYLFPLFSLLFFILYSSWHFGEVEWLHHFSLERNGKLKKLFSFMWGLLFFTIILLANFEDVSAVLGVFSINIHLENFSRLIALSVSGLIWLVLFLLPTVFIWLPKKSAYFKLLSGFILLFILLNSSLLVSFAVYFFYFHSVPSLFHELKLIKTNNQSNPHYLKPLLLEMALFSVIPLLFLAILYFSEGKISQNTIQALIVIGSAVSLPHTIIYSFSFFRV